MKPQQHHPDKDEKEEEEVQSERLSSSSDSDPDEEDNLLSSSPVAHQVSSNQPRQHNITKEEGKALFQNNYDILDMCVEQIQPQFLKILGKHEGDFVNAYLSYMEKVQKELGYWQQKVNDTVGRVMNDQHIAGLQQVIDLYMHEAEAVNSTLNHQRAYYRHLKQQREQLKRERQQTKYEIACTMKTNKGMQIAAKKVNSKNEALRSFLELNQAQKPKNGANQQPLLNIQLKDKLMKNQALPSQQQVSSPQIQASKFNHISAISLFKDPRSASDDLPNLERNTQIYDFVMGLFLQELTNEQIEEQIIKYYKKQDRRRDKSLQSKQRRLQSLRRINYKVKSAQAYDVSERAEVEDVFLDGIEEEKKDKQSLQHNPLLGKVSLNKFALMEVFDSMFGHGGYSGIAFQQMQQKIKDRRASLEGSISIQSNHTANTLQPMSENLLPLENLIQLQKRSKQKAQHLNTTISHKVGSEIHGQTQYTNFTSQRPVSTATGGARKGILSEYLVSDANIVKSPQSSTLYAQPIDRAGTAVDFYKHSDFKSSSIHNRNVTQTGVQTTLNNDYYADQVSQFIGFARRKSDMTVVPEAKMVTLTTNKNSHSQRVPLQVRNGKLVISAQHAVK